MNLYSCTAVLELLNRYLAKGGEVIEVEEGCLGYGTVICVGNGLKTIVIKEVFINEWSSGHTIRKYNKLPKKYSEMILNL